MLGRRAGARNHVVCRLSEALGRLVQWGQKARQRTGNQVNLSGVRFWVPGLTLF